MSGGGVIKVGEYIVIQRHNYKKLHKFNKATSCITLGRETVDLTGIEGCSYHSVFRMVSQGSNKKCRQFRLELADEALDIRDEIDVKISGTDNRNILDDGRSQKLTATEIEELKSDSSKAADIVGSLITNSNTFHNKTEFAQEKYLCKKQKKYFEFIQIVRPNLRIVADIMYRLDPTKIQGIRLDTMSQIVNMANVHSEGIHLLYDSGSNGLVGAAVLNSIGNQSNGKLLHMHPGNMSQKQALLAMNFPEEQFKRCISVNIYSALRQYYQGTDTHCTENKLKRKAMVTTDEPLAKFPKCESNENCETDKQTFDEASSDPKLPRWHYDNIAAAELLKEKVDSLVIACKEDPQNIFSELVQFVKPGRPFVFYHNVAEPLQHLYLILKQQSNVAALKITCNWMRNYQILPDRTHPEVLMNGSSGFLLTGYVLD